jgi:hypothetical protein
MYQSVRTVSKVLYIILVQSISIYILFESLFSKSSVHVAIPQSFSSHIVLAINELNEYYFLFLLAFNPQVKPNFESTIMRA